MPDDEDMLAFIQERKLSFLVVATKSDKLTQSERMKTLNQLQQRFGNGVILFSAQRPQEVKKMQDRLLQFITPSSNNPA
jgi:GTP-binding protein EngB required for normal cell division